MLAVYLFLLNFVITSRVVEWYTTWNVSHRRRLLGGFWITAQPMERPRLRWEDNVSMDADREEAPD